MTKYGLSKNERIRKNRNYERVLKEGIKFRNKIMNLYMLNNQLPYSRLGIIISKKLVKKATQRNRLKRLVREAFRLNKPQLPKGYDIIVHLKEFKVTLKEISDNILKLCQDVKSIK